MKFNVAGYNNYKGVLLSVEASSQKTALNKVLKSLGYKNMILTKMTNSENQKCLDSGINPVDMIDFVVENTESENPITSIGNWHVESKEEK